MLLAGALTSFYRLFVAGLLASSYRCWLETGALASYGRHWLGAGASASCDRRWREPECWLAVADGYY